MKSNPMQNFFLKSHFRLFSALLFFGVLFLSHQSASAQQKTIKGTVISGDKEPIPGATIIVKGTTIGIVTDFEGKFKFNIPSDAKILSFSFVGMKSLEVSIGNKTNFNIVLEEQKVEIEDVVVVGYGSMKKSDLTGAVASVKAEELNTIPAANAMEALSGKVAGLDISSISKPGDSPTVTIRGNRSINASNAPLYVVDGIPRTSIDDIPVNEIQSIEVLKDAVSASIYGSRGANGVILITTKSNIKTGEKTQINVDSYYGINSVNLPEFMTGETYVQYRRDVARYANYGGIGWANGAPLTDDQVFAPQELSAVKNKKYTEWKSLLYNKTTATQQYNLNVSTSGVKSQARFSVGYQNDEGYYPGSDSKRLTFGVKLEQELFPFLKLGINARYTNRIVNDVNPGMMMGYGTNTYSAMNYLNPLIRAYDENGKMIENVVNIYANPLLDYVNPFEDKLTQHRLFNVFSLYLDIIKGLKFTSNFGYDINNRLGDIFYGKNTTKRYIVRDSEGAYAEKNNMFETNLTWDNILNYTNTFGKHNINATAVTSIQSNHSKYFMASGVGLPDDVLGNWNMGLLQANILNQSSYVKSTMASAIGRIQYGYAGRYLFNVSIRADGASVLADGNKWATFPAASAAWVISKEAFYHSKILNTLKLRFSYGTLGNAAINPYETFTGATSVKTNFGGMFTTGYSLSGLVNKDLGWEISKTANIGIDWELLDGRISGYIDAYRTYTSDLLFMRSLPNLTGSTAIWQNIGATSNMGLEFMISSVNIKTNNFRWNTDFNFSTNRSRIEKLITKEDMLDKSLFIGKPWRIFYLNVLQGIWQVNEAAEAAKFASFPGYTKTKDISGPDGIPDGSVSDVYDRVILGQKDPKWMMFMRNSFIYKNVTMAIAMNSKFGHMINMSGSGWNEEFPLAILSDYWTPDNPTGKYPLLSNNMGSLWSLRKGDYINVQEISLLYNFKIFGLKDIGISMQARNPFFLYKAAKDCVDPSAANSDWTAWKSYVIKLDVKF